MYSSQSSLPQLSATPHSDVIPSANIASQLIIDILMYSILISSILESYYGVWPGHSQAKFQMFGNQTKGKTSFSVQCWEAVLQPDTVYYLSRLFILSTLALPIYVEIKNPAFKSLPSPHQEDDKYVRVC